jgi:predicted O-linked N-acetylglucosamine transferase (SPINDLY family)
MKARASAAAAYRSAVARVRAGRANLALRQFAATAAEAPGVATHRHRLGLTLWFQGETAAALAELEEAAALTPDDPDFQGHFGDALAAVGRWSDALTQHRAAVRCAPPRRKHEFLPNLGTTLILCGLPREAELVWREVLRQDPNDVGAINNLAAALCDQGKPSAAVRWYMRLASAPDCPPALHSNLLLASLYGPGRSPRSVFQLHRDWAALHEIARPRPSQRTIRRDRLQIGYISGDFRDHSVPFFLRPILAGHHRGAFKITCYSSNRLTDAITTEMRSLADRWRMVADMDDAALASRIRSDAIDVLVDLSGHTLGNRLPVFSRRPAHVQATYLGYPATTGMSTIDYRITDGVADPPGMTEHLHSEKLVRMDPCFLCYAPPAEAPAVIPLAREVLYVSFAPAAKIHTGTLRVWAEILRRVPGSRLMLKGRGYKDSGVTASLLWRLAHWGIAGRRVYFAGTTPSRAEHLALYGSAAISLDTWPYNGTTTTCESLWMGTPVVTLAGNSHASRVSASILAQAGLTDWVASNEAEYIRVAVDAGRHRGPLAALRRSLRAQLRASPLLDRAAFVRQLEAAYRQMLLR